MAISESRIAPNATIAGLGLDDGEIVDLLFRLEDEFAIEIADEAFRQLHTLADVADHARRAVFERMIEALA